MYIYCIEDCNSLKYVGSTKRTLNTRLIEHKYDKKTNKKKCSSKLLDLNNCKIIVLEECDNSKREEKEEYWINKINCVNINDLTYKHKKRKKQIQKRNIYAEKETQLFRTKKICNQCYEFIKMLENY
tara:strand:- start:1080 stop:1460 length:381 start_codon:yes stop_codon:yes gene_type:complete